ncbi:MAG: cyclic nucleotide-binding domain-containing protein [Verrucomicrobiales bacterium]|nr:cyclic nucleotide-binding domain-containing protein [Verrucomicrobiales bacterium]
MDASATDVGYRIWGADRAVYGPVELPILVSWIREERVLPETWVFSEAQNQWLKAAQCSELQMMFRRRGGASASPGDDLSVPNSLAGIKPASLRRIKLLAGLSDELLEKLIPFLELSEISQAVEITRQGQPGDAMYFILTGEVRVRLLIAGKESVLATLEAGEFFGEMALFDDGPRSADVIANRDTSVVKLTGDSLNQICAQVPELATPLLFALGKSLAARIRADNKRFRDSVNFARSSGSA